MWVIPLSSLRAQPSPPAVDCSPFVQAPVPLNTCVVYPAIPYPERALRAQIEGMVQVRIYVDGRGNYLEHRVVQSSHTLLSSAVGPYISSLEFSPAKYRGEAVSRCIVLPFIFRLERGKKPRIGCPVPLEKKRTEVAQTPRK